MSSAHRFRGSLRGFNREDVVRYIEYLNNKHIEDVNRMRGENQNLTAELAAMRDAQAVDRSEDVARLEERCAELTAALETAQAELEQLRSQMPSEELMRQELEAYRRAEQAERDAKERAAALYRQASGTISSAADHVGTATDEFFQIAEQTNQQIQRLQIAVDDSKQALKEAAEMLGSIQSEE